jgi:hypothetical protein
MARTINEIYDAIIAEKETRTNLEGLTPVSDTSTQLLDDLNSDSKVAIWRLWAYITAVAMHVHEVLWDIFKADIEKIAASAPAGTPGWYHKKVLEYQHGDELVYVDQQYKYATIDLDNRIVARCAIDERADGVVVVKVAKLDGTDLAPLSNDEKNGLISYVGKIKFAGTRSSVFTASPDVVNIVYNLYYDPIVPLVELQTAIDAAMINFSANMPFNGVLNVNKFTDALQAVNGVKDPVFVSATDTAAISGAITTFTIEHRPSAGYFVYAGTCSTMFNFIQKL